MTGGVESTLHQDASSTSSSAAAQAALSHADVEASLHALKAKLSTAISKHSSYGTLTGFWAGDRLTDRETEATGSVSSGTDTVGAAGAGSAPLDFSLNRIASDHATYLVEQALDGLLSEVQAATTQINQKRLQAKCDASIGHALNRFHRESHRFAEVPAYSDTARGYGHDIVTCQDMLSDEKALRSAARERYLSETGAEVGEAELIYRWADEPGSGLTCVVNSLTEAGESPGPLMEGLTPDFYMADDESSSEAVHQNSRKAWAKNPRVKQMNNEELFGKMARLCPEGVKWP